MPLVFFVYSWRGCCLRALRATAALPPHHGRPWAGDNAARSCCCRVFLPACLAACLHTLTFYFTLTGDGGVVVYHPATTYLYLPAYLPSWCVTDVVAVVQHFYRAFYLCCAALGVTCWCCPYTGGAVFTRATFDRRALFKFMSRRSPFYRRLPERDSAIPTCRGRYRALLLMNGHSTATLLGAAMPFTLLNYPPPTPR